MGGRVKSPGLSPRRASARRDLLAVHAFSAMQWGTRLGPRAAGALGTPFLPALNQPRLISLAPDVPSRLFNDNCFLLICQPFIRVFPGERQRQKISNLFTQSTNYPN